MSDSKVIVLGLDGATFDIILPMVADGKLPAFARMMKEGAWGYLESVPNQRSAAAWTTFQTGTNPGKHGVYEFYDYVPETYGLKFINGGARQGQSLWRLLSQKGKKVGAINVPMTYPAEEVNGFLIAGLDCPSVHSKGFAYPESLLPKLQREVGAYMIEPGITGLMVAGRQTEAAELVRRELAQKMDVTRFLMQTEPCDFLMVVFRSLDAVQHNFWKHMDAAHPRHEPTEASEFDAVIPDTYALIDRYLGEFLAARADDTTIIVMSDHGFGAKNPATMQINDWLQSRGYLAYRSSRRKGVSGRALAWLYRKVVGLTSRSVKERLWAMFPSVRDSVQSRLCFASMDWKRTQAYSDSLFPNIRINLRGREGQGVVAPGPECDVLVEKIICELRELRDGKSGEKIVQDVFRKEESYQGPHMPKAPDILIRWREDIPISGIRIEGAREHVSPTAAIPGEDPRVISGDHRLNGIFLAVGPDIGKGKRIDGARILDLAPSLLHLMGVPIPPDMDGAVLTDMFEPAGPRGAAEVIREGAPSDQSQGPHGGGTYRSGEEEAQIHERLRNLGYVE